MRRQGILGPDAFRPPARTPEQLGWGIWAIGAAMIYLVMPFGAQIALTISGDLGALEAGSMSLRAMAVATIGSSVAGVAAAAALLGVLSRRRSGLGFRLHATDLSWGLAITIAALPIVLLITNLASIIAARVTGETPDPLAHETLRLMVDAPGSTWWWVMVAGVVIAAPIAEELLYRGFLQSSLVALTGSRSLAIVITSVIFASVHIGTADWRALPGLFALSIALGIAFERKGRIGIPITMHALFNLFNVVISM